MIDEKYKWFGTNDQEFTSGEASSYVVNLQAFLADRRKNLFNVQGFVGK